MDANHNGRDEAAQAGRSPERPLGAETATRTPEPGQGPTTVTPPETGDPDLDAALAELAELAGPADAPLGEHIEAGERVHRLLRGRLGDLDEA